MPDSPPRDGLNARRVTPATAPRNPFLSRNFLITLGSCCSVNILFTNVFFAPAQPKSVVIPYDVFVQQVKADNVTSVTSTSDAITGTTKKPVTAGVGPGHRHQLLDAAALVRQRRPARAAAGAQGDHRRAEPQPADAAVADAAAQLRPGAAPGAALRVREPPHGLAAQRRRRHPGAVRPERRAAVQRRAPADHVRGRRRDRRGEGRAARGRRLPQGARQVRAPRRHRPQGRAAHRRARARARRCWRAPSPARRACPSSRSPRRSSSRPSSAWARLASATSSARRARPRPRSSSSTRWTRWDGRAALRCASAATTSRSRRSTRSSPRWTGSTRTRA